MASGHRGGPLEGQPHLSVVPNLAPARKMVAGSTPPPHGKYLGLLALRRRDPLLELSKRDVGAGRGRDRVASPLARLQDATVARPRARPPQTVSAVTIPGACGV